MSGLKSVEGKTYVITGGASGLGGECTKLFHSKGANVVVLDLNKEDGEKIVKEIDPDQKRLLFIVTDVSDEGKTKRFILRCGFSNTFRTISYEFFSNFQ